MTIRVKQVASCPVNNECSRHFICYDVIVVAVFIITTCGLIKRVWWQPDSLCNSGIPQKVSLYLPLQYLAYIENSRFYMLFGQFKEVLQGGP